MLQKEIQIYIRFEGWIHNRIGSSKHPDTDNDKRDCHSINLK